MMSAAIPECLRRTSADDREDAYKAVGAMTPREHGNLVLRAEYAFAEGGDSTGDRLTREAKRFVEKPEGYDDALAAIQRREAEVVADIATRRVRENTSLGNLARLASADARFLCGVPLVTGKGEPTTPTLDQRARLLDAARVLVALALEVAG
jgi:hypothetical protein